MQPVGFLIIALIVIGAAVPIGLIRYFANRSMGDFNARPARKKAESASAEAYDFDEAVPSQS